VDTVSCVPNDIAQFMLENKSQKGFNAIEESDFVFVYDTDLNGDYPVLANRVRAALNKGTKLGVVSSGDNELESSAQVSLQICSNMMEEFLSAFNAFMKNCDAKEISEDFAAEKDAVVELGKCFAEAKNPVIICDGEIVTRYELDLFKEFAKKAELIVMQSGNYLGLKLMGVDPNYMPSGKPAEEEGLGFFDVIEGIKKKEIKGVLVVADEDGTVPEIFAEDVFVTAVTPVYQMELKNADVVLPGAAYPEKNGSYINAEGRKQFSNQAVKPLAGKDSWEVLGELASKLGCSCSSDEINFEAVAQAVQKIYEKA
jgi:NADH dehydrogenase/NADH:ubiquinone oxidoreductase subunit G